MIRLILLSCALLAADDRCLTCGNKGRDSYTTLYDTSTVESVRGTITSVETMTGGSGRSYGVHLTIQTQRDETLSVHLGPSWYLQRHGIAPEVGEAVRVTGSRVTLDGQPALIASEIQVGGRHARLRSEEGYPSWSGRRRQ
jgi:hypothetical protein